MLNFNMSGLLVPDSIIKTNLNEFELEFVANIPTQERKNHFNAYVNYSNALKKVSNLDRITQWLDGSYITKTLKPKDIDLVTFLDFNTVELLGDKINQFIYPQSKMQFEVDAYIIQVYPEENKKYFFYQADRAYWIDKFDKTKRNRLGNKLAKGFLEIIY